MPNSLIRPKTSTKRHYGFVGLKKIDDGFISSVEEDWHGRAKIKTRDGDFERIEGITVWKP